MAKKRRAVPGAQAPKYRWQDAGRGRPRRVSGGLGSLWNWRMYAGLGLALLVLLVVLLVFRKQKTPLLAISITQYAHPLPPNAWAREDRLGLQNLTENLSSEVLPDDWKSLLGAIDKQGRGKTPLIVYVSMHGVVDADGNACLLPAGASPLNAKDWIKVDSLLQKLKEKVPAERPKLLVLDCHRMLIRWNCGVLYNSFAERLDKSVRSEKVPNLAVITSAGPGQVNWASGDLRGSCFGMFLRMGLAGAADRDTGGNADGEVSLHELDQYLKREVSRWTKWNRGQEQLPVLLGDTGRDFRVAFVSNRKLKALTSELTGNSEKALPSVRTDDIASLWTELENLRQYDPVRNDPIGWCDLQQQLLWIEQAAEAGEAYEDVARRESQGLRKRLEQISSRAASYKTSRTWLSHWAMFSDRVLFSNKLTLHTLPLCEFFDQYDEAKSEDIRSVLDRLLEPMSDAQPVLAPDHPAQWLGATHFLLAARRENVAALWKEKPRVVAEALQLRQRSEQLAVPGGISGDERAHYHVRSVLEKADAARWKLEDCLFVGESLASRAYDALKTQAVSEYDTAESVWKQAAQAFAERDRACVELPYLARWLWAPASLETSDDSQHQRLLELIDKTHLLAGAVSQPAEVDQKVALPFVELAEDVAAERQQLNESFKASCQELIEHGVAKPETLGKLQAVLNTALIPADKRRTLLKLHAGVATELHKTYRESRRGGPPANGAKRPARSEPDSAGDETAERPGLLEQLSLQHPVTTLLQSPRDESLGTDPLVAIEQDGERVRRILEDVSTFERARPRSAASGKDAVVEYRRELCAAEHHVRAAAAIGLPASTEPNALARLRYFDLQQLLLWHRRQAIDEFWGSPVSLGLIGDQAPLYAVAADNYMKAAATLLDEVPKPVADQIERQNQSLQLRQSAAFQLDPNSKEVSDDRIHVEIDAKPTSSSQDYPEGFGAVYLRDGKQRLTDLDLGPLNLPFDEAQQFPLDLTTERARQLGTPLQTVVFFRDHPIASKPLVITPFQGVAYEYQPHRYKVTSIQLDGDRPQESHFILILDCSQSMKHELLEGEAPAKSKARLELAKTHLATMLDDLVTRGDVYIGVMFFGHRVGYSDPNSVRMEQADWPRPIPAGLAPQKDVEVIRPLGRFEGTDAKEVKDLLGPNLRHWGESPLFLSVVQALGQFRPETAETRNGIIAITDGGNYQTGGSELTARDVIKKSNSLKVPIHFLDFGGKKLEETATANEEFQKISKESGGVYSLVTTGNDLLARLRERLELDGYFVNDSQGNPVGAERDRFGALKATRLNDAVQIPPELIPGRFTVQYEAVEKQVELEGGEAIHLQVNREGTDIRALAYDRGVVREGGLTTAVAQSAEHLFRVHRPIRKSGATAVQFKVSLQAKLEASHFTRRPRETWLEITPLAGESQLAGDTHVFYDTNFEPREPVPVLQWRAEGWPENADHARIAFWCKQQITLDETTIPLAAVRKAEDQFKKFQRDRVTGAPGVALRIRMESDDNVYRIHVAEQHDQWSRIRIRFQTDPDVKPIRVRRRIDRKNKFATHEFLFSNTDKQKIEDYQNSAIKIATREAVLDGAWGLEHPLLAPVSEDGGYLPIGSTVPSGGQPKP